MPAYLTITTGSRVGEELPLDPLTPTQIGRGTDCGIVLDDPLCSRVHAIIQRTDGQWRLTDAKSRNGTFVDGKRTDGITLVAGMQLRFGSVECAFNESNTSQAEETSSDLNITQSILQDVPVDSTLEGLSLDLPADDEKRIDPLALFKLSIKLLGCDDPDEVVRLSLEVIHKITSATVVGFHWLGDEGTLKPQHVVPPGAPYGTTLSKSLTNLVCQQRHAVWVADQTAGGDSESLTHYADAICVPVVHDGDVVGAIHHYLVDSEFRQGDFDFAIAAVHALAAALVRARRQESLATQHRRLADKTATFDDMLGKSEPMRRLKQTIARVARASGCVLVRGESGVGKELVARALHRASSRRDRPLLAVNCAAIPGELMESQLFGHRKGAFTGAERDHIGWFEQAHTGTLFLDEVGEMTLDGQAKLLRILEGHPFLPLGSQQEVNVDVRIIAATNQDLRDYVQDKKFREDLYYRLSVFELFVPPLRDRGDDVELLIDFFVDHFRRQHGRPGLTIGDEARRRLREYAWPGNVRQLRNVIDSAVILAEGDTIEPSVLGLRDAGTDQLQSLRIDDWERKLIQEALSRTQSNVAEAAVLLGIGRATLYRKIEEYQISR